MRDFLEGRVEGSEEKAKEIVDIWNRFVRLFSSSERFIS